LTEGTPLVLFVHQQVDTYEIDDIGLLPAEYPATNSF